MAKKEKPVAGGLDDVDYRPSVSDRVDNAPKKLGESVLFCKIGSLVLEQFIDLELYV